MATTEGVGTGGLGVTDIRAVIAAFRDALVAHRARINSLNVYPVPDGDTGTNMSLTLGSVMAEVEAAGEDPAAMWRAISHGSLMGARGNSGVILCQILRGLVDSLAACPVIDSAALAAAFREAADAAYHAVGRPVEGTILTVMREMAEEAEALIAASGPAELVGFLEGVRVRGHDALARTPSMLPVLADAGVVDAGGAGLLLLIDALLHVADGRALPAAPASPADGPVAGPSHADGVGDLRYEVMYLLETERAEVEGFKAAWGEIGDSVVVVGGDGLYNCHVHTNDIGAAVEVALDYGRPRGIRVTDLFEELAHVEDIQLPGAEADADDGLALDPTPCVTAVVAVGAGAGVRRIFQSLGVRAVVTGGQTMNPSTAQLLEAAEAVAADQVIVLPNNKNIIAVAEQVDALSAKSVLVVPTRGIAEGFASLLAYDPEATAEENREAMVAAASGVVAGEVTQAVRNASSDLGPITEGDWLGLARWGIVAVADSAVAAATALLDQLVTSEHEIVTVILGADAEAVDGDAVAAWLQANRPDVEVEMHHGLQPLYPFTFGIE
jgi:hypothetical protein